MQGWEHNKNNLEGNPDSDGSNTSQSAPPVL